MSEVKFDPVGLATVEELRAWAVGERDALAERVARLEEALAECIKERGEMLDRLAWAETVAAGQSALWEMRVSEFRGLVRTVVQSVRSAP